MHAWKRGVNADETTTAAVGKHPTGMFSCYSIVLIFFCLLQESGAPSTEFVGAVDLPVGLQRPHVPVRPVLRLPRPARHAPLHARRQPLLLPANQAQLLHRGKVLLHLDLPSTEFFVVKTCTEISRNGTIGIKWFYSIKKVNFRGAWPNLHWIKCLITGVSSNCVSKRNCVVQKSWLNLSKLITSHKRSLGQGNVFRSFCQSFCSQGEGVSLRIETPPGQRPHPVQRTPRTETPLLLSSSGGHWNGRYVSYLMHPYFQTHLTSVDLDATLPVDSLKIMTSLGRKT